MMDSGVMAYFCCVCNPSLCAHRVTQQPPGALVSELMHMMEACPQRQNRFLTAQRTDAAAGESAGLGSAVTNLLLAEIQRHLWISSVDAQRILDRAGAGTPPPRPAWHFQERLAA